LVLLTGLACATCFSGSALAAGCDRYGSPSGSDSGAGTLASPYLTVEKLETSLSPGQTGCLEAGTYGNTSTWSDLTSSGTSGSQITLTAAPGQTVTVDGWTVLDGSYITVSGLNLDDSNTFYAQQRSGTTCPYPVSQALDIEGSGDILQYDDIYQSVASLRGNLIGIGFAHSPADTIIRYDKIHDAGQCDAYDHLIYVSHGTGAQIYDNWIWNDPHGWGVQLYPDAVDAHVHDNVIDHAGSGFVVGGASTGDLIDHNVVTNSTGLPDAGLPRGVGISESDPGANNTFQSNDVFNNPGGIGNDPSLKLTANTTTNPGLADASAHDYSVAPGSPLAGWGLWNGSVG
jgi:hypothetical protein